MRNIRPKMSRRRFTQLAGTSAVIPLSAVLTLLSANAHAAQVDERSPEAKALKYTSRSSKAGQKCGNCTLYQGKSGRSTGTCPLFTGVTVNEGAWCSAWVPRA